ncbi:MAG TPA: TadE/TadG family type IV pilus assembly protein [Burkholderiaceae bacterium]|nr:TadE/TadG family type IV pilus assembly protein [Burkholderiaceae bacterium]
MKRQRGASLAEATIVLPLLLFSVLAVIQAALVFHAKSSVNYAVFQAARAGTMDHARIDTIKAAFKKAILPYYGGGRTTEELADSAAKVAEDVTDISLRIEILSPTRESFQDYNSPRLQTELNQTEPVIPNVGLDELTCPRDGPDCNSNPATNASGQTLLDANLLKLRITYGIPPAKQMPMVGRFYTWALNQLNSAGGDSFKQALLDAGRIPVVTQTVMRMQSEPIRNAAMVSSPGAGNSGNPVDPGPAPGPGGGTSDPGGDPSSGNPPGGGDGSSGADNNKPPEEPPCF